MSDYERTSQICVFSQLPAILRLGLQQQAEEYHCGQIPDDILMCIETMSERKQAAFLTRLKDRFTGLPAPGMTQHCAAVVLPSWLIWAFTHWGNEDQATVLSVRLNEAEISEYNQTHLTEDHGLNILGFLSGSTERSLQFLGLGKGGDAEQFKQFVQKSAQSAKTS